MEITQKMEVNEHGGDKAKLTLDAASQVIASLLFSFVNDTMSKMERGECVEPARVSILPAMIELFLKYYL